MKEDRSDNVTSQADKKSPVSWSMILITVWFAGTAMVFGCLKVGLKGMITLIMNRFCCLNYISNLEISVVKIDLRSAHKFDLLPR